MSGFTMVHMDDFERPFPKWALARKSLGLESFGMNVVELPPGETIPEHDETGSDQEEVFIVLSGEATMVIDGEDHPAPAGTFTRLDPEAEADGRQPQRRPRDDSDRLGAADERLHAAGLGIEAGHRRLRPGRAGDLRPRRDDRAGRRADCRGRRRRRAARRRRRSCPRIRRRRGRRRSPAGPSPARRRRSPCSTASRSRCRARRRPARSDRARARVSGSSSASTRPIPAARSALLALLYWSPAGELALHHRKLVPTNHERLVWGQGDGRGWRSRDAARAHRRPDLLGELHAARSLLALRVGRRDLSRLDRRRRRPLAGRRP